MRILYQTRKALVKTRRTGLFTSLALLVCHANLVPRPPAQNVVGVDIAKDSFTACMGCIDLTQQLHFLGRVTTFSNDVTGFIALQAWAATHQAQVELPLGYVLEATGVYHEELAYYLHTQQQTLSVLLPSKAKHFARSTELKSKTDLLDARLLRWSSKNRQCEVSERV